MEIILDFNHDKIINFNEIYDEKINDNNEVINNTLYKKIYNNRTTENFKKIRELKLDPITTIETSENSFKFNFIWDPITGQRLLENDPYGPLCFDPLNLCLYFYQKRLEHLWIDEVDEGEGGGYYEGYYGDGVGAGKNFKIEARGEYPEYYLFRIPINDCYLIEGTPKSIPTKGPELFRNEIIQIYELCKKCPSSEWQEYFTEIPNLEKMFDLYNQAIDDEPNIEKFLEENPQFIGADNPKHCYNTVAIEKLKEL